MIKKEIKAFIVLIIGILISITVCNIFINFLNSSINKVIIIIIAFLFYLIFVNILGSCFGNTKNKVLKNIIYSISVPAAVIILILNIIGPFMLILWTLFLYFIYSALLPVILLMILSYFIELPVELTKFIIYSLVPIIAISFHKTIMNFIFKSPNVKSKYYIDDKIKYNEELITYIFNINNVRFLIYLLYFIYLILFSIKSISGGNVFETEGTDYSILQAFLVFLAFDSIRINSKDVKLIASKILEKSINIIDNQTKDHK